MKKQLLISFLTLFTIAFLLSGCEKTKNAPEKKSQIEKPVPAEKTPSTETMTTTKEIEITGDEKKGVTSRESPTNDNQKFEGSQSLKRYLDDSP